MPDPQPYCVYPFLIIPIPPKTNPAAIEDSLAAALLVISGRTSQTREEAEAFAKDPKNVDYHGDIAVFCGPCGYFHLSKEDCLPARPWETVASKLRIA